MALSFSGSIPAGESRRVAIGNVAIDLVWCPPGSFRMGASGPEPDAWESRHVVRLSHGFWIGRTTVMPPLWLAAMKEELPGIQRDEEMPLSANWPQAVALTESLTRLLRESRVLEPAHVVSLPTEAQWEYACRAGTDTRWYFGDDERLLIDHAWYAANSGNRMHPVAGKLPNPWGLFDVYGNVREWCLDDLGPFSGEEEVDPFHVYSGELKVTRGGGYDERADACRSGSRLSMDRMNDFGDDVGFRIVLGRSPSNNPACVD